MKEFDELASELVEVKYQLRIEHNHGDIKWYAYYAGKGANLTISDVFDIKMKFIACADTPSQALTILRNIVNEQTESKSE